MRYLCIVEYDGSNYAGWQIQPNTLSLEEVIEEKLSKILNTSTKIYGSGRTDAKVHAYGQTFHFDSKEISDLEKFRYSFNQVLPEDIHILSIEKVSDDFNARLSATSKTYMYVLNNGEYDPFSRNYVTQLLRHVDVNKIIDASQVFVGKHNFQNYTSKDEDEDNFVREIYSIDVIESRGVISMTFNGNGFMRYMIRFIVGTLIQVGLGKLTIEDIKATLDTKERHITSYKADPQGLYLLRVNYEKK